MPTVGRWSARFDHVTPQSQVTRSLAGGHVHAHPPLARSVSLSRSLAGGVSHVRSPTRTRPLALAHSLACRGWEPGRSCPSRSALLEGHTKHSALAHSLACRGWGLGRSHPSRSGSLAGSLLQGHMKHSCRVTRSTRSLARSHSCSRVAKGEPPQANTIDSHHLQGSRLQQGDDSHSSEHATRVNTPLE
jgi:hypothetical protein